MEQTQQLQQLLAAGRAGGKRATGKLISLVEQGGPAGRAALRFLWPHTGHARILGVTGPPGAGKSTLVDKLAKAWRAQNLRVGIVAVDPTSPFTGGALLGDRVRMADLALDPGVFIRSMGTRGQLGGLSGAAAGAASALDACGYDLVLLETVGVGQSEVAVAAAADVVMVLSVPGLGDDVQAIKAGILEIGDLFVVNKADRPGADRVAQELRAMLELGGDPLKKTAPVLLASATKGEGVQALCNAIDSRFIGFLENGELPRRRAARLRQELLNLVQAEFARRVLAPVLESENFRREFEDFLAHKSNPYEWVETVIDRMKSGPAGS